MYTAGPFTSEGLLDRGIGARERTRLVSQGRLVRLKRGWYSDTMSAPSAVRAVELGGRLGCLSACRLHGLWVPHDPDLHVMLNPGVHRPSGSLQGIQLHRLARPCHTAVAPVGEAVEHVLRRHDTETGFVVLESAVNLGYLDEAEAHRFLAAAPQPTRRAAHFFSARAQSGSETRLRLFFQGLGVPVQPQAFVPGVGRVDLLVGRSWIVEADSTAHHSAPRDVLVDSGRDMNSRESGYDRDRLSFEQIWHSWDSTRGFLTARLRTRRHLRPPVPLRRGA